MTRKSLLFLSVAFAVQATCTIATRAQPNEVTSLSGYQAGDLYLPSSRVYALVGKTGLGHEHGVSGGLKSGRLRLGATQNAGELVFDMTSFTADTDAARRFVRLAGASSESTRQQVTANMLGADVLNVAKYATASYRIDSAVQDPDQGVQDSRRYRIIGQFTLQSVTLPLTVLAEVDVKNGWNRVRGSFPLRQTDFGIKPYTKAFGAVGVADEMTVWGEFWVAPSSGVAH